MNIGFEIRIESHPFHTEITFNLDSFKMYIEHDEIKINKEINSKILILK